MLYPFGPRSKKSNLVFQLLYWEGAFSLAFDTWTGPTYFSGIAGELGMGVGLLSLITMAPWIGSIGQFVFLGAYQRCPSVRDYVVRLAATCRALWLFPIAMGWVWGLHAAIAHESFPAKKWFLLATCVGAIAQLIGSSSGAAWMSWVRELVSPRTRGSFFGTRQRYTYAAVIAVHLLGIALAGWMPKGLPGGYGILLVLALGSAALSTFFLSKVPDVRFEGDARGKKWIEAVREPLDDRGFLRLMVFNAAFQGSVQLAGPYFPYYFTHELRIPMSFVAFWTVLTNVGWFIAASGWGRKIDHGDGCRSSFWITANLISISPLFYAFTGASAVSRLAPLDYLASGLAWAGYTLVFTKLLLERSGKGKCAGYFAVSSAATAIASAAGNLLGGQIASLFGFRALFVIAAIARFGVVWGMGHFFIGDVDEVDHPNDFELICFDNVRLARLD